MEKYKTYLNWGCILVTVIAFLAFIVQVKLRIRTDNTIDLLYRENLIKVYLVMFLTFAVLAILTA
jgi:hypothetical protein